MNNCVLLSAVIPKATYHRSGRAICRNTGLQMAGGLRGPKLTAMASWASLKGPPNEEATHLNVLVGERGSIQKWPSPKYRAVLLDAYPFRGLNSEFEIVDCFR